ncbi:alpha/beta fold hydrolase [Streptomyces sp. NBC_00503]|uniref:alpha/beta fold hydrolase n=1 Tax=Streptomyces sp. NBC_00503 TaxID=2903659 RepID=UPI002E818F96|nr:alpha/beta fold hydrolase [Streptomyces sp. NBC_00503]
MTEHHALGVNGVRLAYQVSGPAGGAPLVLLPALGEGADHWSPVREALARDRRVYALDLRGHGRSERTAAYSLELMRDDVLGLLDALCLDRVDLVGHSMGGVVAHLVAQHSPWRVARLVLEDVPAPLPREPVAPVQPEGELDFDWTMVLAVRPQLDRPDPSWLSGLDRITARTLVIAGGPASHIPQDGVAELARRIPDALLTTIPVGHLVHAAAPAEFTAAVSAFLDELPDIELARRWLAEDGITQIGEGVWADADSPGELLDRDDIANGLGSMAFTDERLYLAGRLRVALGLMDLLGGHVLVTGQVHSAHLGPEGPLPTDLLWDGYRRRLEAVREYPAITDSLWFDWFEVAQTADEAFTEVLGNDREQLLPGAPEALLRRARRVLEHSGPVSWPGKADTYRAAARTPALHHAVFRAVLRSYHDVYGRLDPAEALCILGGLDVPPETEHLAGLRRALAAGHRDPRPALRAPQDAPGPDARAGGH